MARAMVTSQGNGSVFVAEGRRPLLWLCGGTWFDLAMVVLCGWLLGGAALDAWAHSHIPALETFFTPWHGVLYSGYLSVALFLGGVWTAQRLRGVPWRRAVPAGYGLSLVGVVLFAWGGVGDMLWHQLFGIEVNVDAALSPTHLFLGCSAGLILSGPLRAAWQRAEAPPSWPAYLPLLLSLAYVFSLCTLLMAFVHPLVVPLAANENLSADPDTIQALGVAGLLLQAALLSGFLLLLVRRWPALPWGSLTLICTLNATLLSFLHDQYRLIPAAAAAGLAADLLLHLLRPTAARVGPLRLFAFVLPALYTLLYFLALWFTGGIWWSIHLWLGSAVLAGICGLLLSYLLVPPAIPDVAEKVGT